MQHYVEACRLEHEGELVARALVEHPEGLPLAPHVDPACLQAILPEEPVEVVTEIQ